LPFSVALQVFSVASVFRFSNLNTENTEKGEELGETFVHVGWRSDSCKFPREV
jgi:hypothetical protein